MSVEGVLKNIICLAPCAECLVAYPKQGDKVSKGELKPELHFRINEAPTMMGMGFPETAQQS